MERTVIQVMGRNHIAGHPQSVDLFCGQHSGAGYTLHKQIVRHQSAFLTSWATQREKRRLCGLQERGARLEMQLWPACWWRRRSVLLNCTYPSIVPPSTAGWEETLGCHRLVLFHPRWLLSLRLFFLLWIQSILMSLRWNEWINKQIISPGFLKLSLEMLIDSFIPFSSCYKNKKKKSLLHPMGYHCQFRVWAGVQKINLGLFCSFVLICLSLSSHPWRPLTSVTSIPVIQKPEKETFLSFPFLGSPRQGETLASTAAYSHRMRMGVASIPSQLNCFQSSYDLTQRRPSFKPGKSEAHFLWLDKSHLWYLVNGHHNQIFCSLAPWVGWGLSVFLWLSPAAHARPFQLFHLSGENCKGWGGWDRNKQWPHSRCSGIIPMLHHNSFVWGSL